MNRHPFKLTFAATIVAAAMPTSNALAQENASCQQLLEMVMEADNNVSEEFRDARTVGEADDPNQCTLYIARVTEAGGLMINDDSRANAQNETQTKEVSETIQVEQQATIEGEVQVTLPDPQVRVEQDPADISVRTTPPEVNVSQGQPKITVRQAQPIITVQMQQPTITIEQPAPEIVVTMPEPGVDVATTRPTVDVVIPEPRVTVTQGDPQLSVDLDTTANAEGESAAGSNTQVERTDEEGVMTVRASGLSGGVVEPRIQYMEGEEQPVINFSGAEPQVDYVTAEPDVRVNTEGEPTIELVESGEPKIMIQSAEQAENDAEAEPSTVAALDQKRPESADAESQRDPQEAFAADTDSDLGEAASGTVTVGELVGMEVRNTRSEDLGEVDRIVRNGNDTYMIIAHGGWFLGLNDKEYALPIADVSIRENEVILRGLSEDQIEALPDYDYNNEIALESNEEVTLQRVN